MGIRLQKFTHESFLSGENKGDPPSTLRTSELDRSLNVELRGVGIATRYGMSPLTVAGSPTVPTPISGNPTIVSIFGFTYGDVPTYEDLFSAGTSLYKDPESPTAIKTGLTSGLRFYYVSVGDVVYATNGTDPVQFFDTNRSTTTTYDAGYPIMNYTGITTATATSGGSLIDNTTYEYHVVFYDSNTETRANPAATALSQTTGAAAAADDNTITLDVLPLDSANRTDFWEIYRKGPNDYYFYYIDRKAYNPADRTYVDTTPAVSPRRRVLEYDNFAPDPSAGMFYMSSQKVMVYFDGNIIQWGKPYRNQNVPTFNREILDDSSNDIVVGVELNSAAVLFKSNTIYVIRGNFTTGSYKIRKFSKTIGTRSPKSVVVDTNGIFFIDSTGRPRYITPTDFDNNDLRDSTDISRKYRNKFNKLDRSYYDSIFAVMWKTDTVNQYRVFLPIETEDNLCNHCYVYDLDIARNNQGDSAWFDFRYNGKLSCGTIVGNSTTGVQLHCGDDFGLIWRLDVESLFYDGYYNPLAPSNDFTREEGGETLTFTVGGTTIQFSAPAPTWDVNIHRGNEVIIYTSNTFDEFFRSKIISNTADTLTLQDSIPDLTPAVGDSTDGDPYITIGGYLTYFATAWFTRDHSGKNVPDKLSISFDAQYEFDNVYIFVNYDFNQIFNYTYDYMNNPANPSRFDGVSTLPHGDTYLWTVSGLYVYGVSVYGTARYSSRYYSKDWILLRSYYWFSDVSWGCIARGPNEPFGYIGGSLYYKTKGDFL